MTNLTCSLEKFDSNLWHHHIPIPTEVAEKYIEGDNRRVLCTINNQVTLQAALMKAEPYWFVLVNKAAMTKLNIKEGSIVQVELEKDRSEYGLEMTEEMEVLLQQDDEGREYFQQLTMGKQRSLIYIAGQVKNSHSRLNRALAILDHLKEQRGKLDFKLLNQRIKDYNQRGGLKI